MKILLLGEYSNLHWTLAGGLRELGHEVTVASDGDGFKNYQRDIDLARKSSGIRDTWQTFQSVRRNLENFKGYDVVQLINPCFTQLNIYVNAWLYPFLKKHNKKIFLGAFGVDSYWLKACLDKNTFRYSEFYIRGKENPLEDNEKLKSLWLGTKYESLNQHIANTCNGVIACLYEYYVSYEKLYNGKLAYIPLPVNLNEIPEPYHPSSGKISFFLGINKARSNFKGTDIMCQALRELQNKYPDKVELIIAESLPYEEYTQKLESSDIVLDQLYSYTPAMNGLLAMAMGKVLVGGGEPEMYELLGEVENMPVINVFPSEEDVFNRLEDIVKNKEIISRLSENSRKFVEKHHNHIEVARKYIEFWNENE